MEDGAQQRVCIDCQYHQPQPSLSREHPGYCVHLTPDYWADQGWERNWGDAAVMAWPTLEILKRRQSDRIEYLILNGELRRPVRLYVTTSVNGWGAF